jgi:hypothetical protein
VIEQFETVCLFVAGMLVIINSILFVKVSQLSKEVKNGKWK